MKSTEATLIERQRETLSKLTAYEGLVYEGAVGGRVFADCRGDGQVLSGDIIRARIVALAVNQWRRGHE